MWNKLAVAGRWCAICALWVVIALAAALSWLLHVAASGPLAVGELAQGLKASLHPARPMREQNTTADRR